MASKELPGSDLVAAVLLESGAVKVSVKKPFTLTSGAKSPLYFDCRRLISNPAAMNIIAGMFQGLIASDKMKVDFVAGGESAGIPFADRLATVLGKPMLYIRKKPRETGTGSQIEGCPVKNANAILVEDMITDGGSKLTFINGLRKDGLKVEHCLVVLDRGQGGKRILKSQGVLLHALTDALSVLSYGLRSGKLSRSDVNAVRKYLKANS